MKRVLLSRLENQWLRQDGTPPLLLRGARQVGKTWLARELGRLYGHLVEVNLETDRETHAAFDAFFGDPQSLIKNLGVAARKPIIPGQSFLFLDEIQECESALKSLRYFKEKMPGLKVLATGSLLEFLFKKLSFPVGRVDFQWLQPMNLLEFIWASSPGVERIDELVPPLLEKRMQEYLSVGGLPESVLHFTQSGSVLDAAPVIKRLSAAYRADFPKYASTVQTPLLSLIYDRVPRLWGEKIKYTSLSPDYRARDLEAAIHVLIDAGLLRRSLHSSANGLPLSAEAKFKDFKLFSLDVALGLTQLQAGAPTPRFEDLLNKGEVLEQLVAQELCAYTGLNEEPQLYFWRRETPSSRAEVDFLISRQGRVIPLEVKSGTNQKSKSLALFLQEKKREEAYKITWNTSGKDRRGNPLLPIWKLHTLVMPR